MIFQVMASKYPLNYNESFNPNINIMAESLKDSGINNIEEYIEASLRVMESMGLDFQASEAYNYNIWENTVKAVDIVVTITGGKVEETKDETIRILNTLSY